MAKKSNKTEQVLKLITKKEDAPENPRKTESPQAEVCVQPGGKQEHKIETKLKIEIEPEIKIKPGNAPDEELHIEVPVDIIESSAEKTQRCFINLTERLVQEKAKEVMDRLNVCSCPACTQDVLVQALNALPPKYVAAGAGKQQFPLETYKKQYETDIVSALTRASILVKVSPGHGKQ